MACSLNKNVTQQQARLALNKIKILGLLNFSLRNSRDASGIYINGQIIKGSREGSKDTTEFDDFLMDPDNVLPDLDLTKGNIIIGHVRAASAGTAKIDGNAHPHWIKSSDPKNDIVAIHNGSISNPWELCKKYDIDHVTERIQLDSKALFTLIDRVGVQVLEEYKGSAALIWCKPAEPNTIYVYHGASYEYSHSKAMAEERPLYSLQAEEGVYFASEARFLCAIRESLKQEVIEVAFNTVQKITNGKRVDKDIIINREQTNMYIAPTSTWNRPTVQQGSSMGRSYPATSLHRIKEDYSQLTQKGGKAKGPKTPSINICWQELAPIESLAKTEKNYISYFKGRYHLANGVLASGLLWIKDRGIIVEEGEGSVPHWFWSGVLLKSQQSYEQLVTISNVSHSWVNSATSNYAGLMSKYSKFPCCNLETECINENDLFRFSFYKDEKRVHKDTFTPDFSGRTYKIEKGFLVEITSSHKNDKIFKEEDTKTLSAFDIIFHSHEELMETLSSLELSAVENYVYDMLKQEWNQAPLLVESQPHMWQLIRTALAGGMTLREVLKDDNCILEMYVDNLRNLVETEGFPQKPQPPALIVNNIEEMTDAGFGTLAKQVFSYPEKGVVNLVEKKHKYDFPWPDDENLHDAAVADYEEIMSESEIDRRLKEYEEATEDFAETEIHQLSCNKIGELIDVLQEVATIGEELSTVSGSDYSTDAAQIVRIGVEDMKHKLGEVCEVNHDPENLLRINQIVNQ